MPLFQNESKCETFHMKMSFVCSLQVYKLRRNSAAAFLFLQRGTFEMKELFYLGEFKVV